MSPRWCITCRAYRGEHQHSPTLWEMVAEEHAALVMPDPRRSMTGPFHRNDPQTSRDAATRDLPRKGTQRARVLDAFREVGPQGATDYEMGERLGLFRWVAGTRRGELIGDGWPIVDTGVRRPTDTASNAIVWALEAL